MHNILLLLGTIIGAGMFSLPLALKNIGILPFSLLLLFLTIALGIVNFYYFKVVQKVNKQHQLPGYAGLVLGKRAGFITSLLQLFSTFGALLAYLIIGGDFLRHILPVSAFQGSLFFFGLVFYLLLFTGKLLEKFDAFFTYIKVLILSLVILGVLWKLDLQTVPIAHLDGRSLLAYGSVLFALTGFSIVPRLLKTTHVKGEIFKAQLVATVVYGLFALGLVRFLQGEAFVFYNPYLNFAFNLAGFFSVLTPYLMLSWVAYDVFDKDLHFSKPDAIKLTLAVPVFFFLMGVKSFMTVISVTGGVFLALMAVVILEMYKKLFPHSTKLLILVLELVFILGAVAEIVSLL